MRKGILIALLIMNFVVLLGQIWPEGAPPFAATVNIIFLICSFVFLANLLQNKKNG